jgi:predicted phosphodiesterase
VARKTPDWALELAPAFYQLVAQGVGREEAAHKLRADHPSIIGALSLETIQRAMRLFKAELVNGGLQVESDDGSLAPLDFVDAALQEAILAVDGRTRRVPKGSVPPPLTPTAFSPLVLPYKDSLVWSDVHIPYHLPEAMERSLDSALDKGITRIILAGDFMDVHWGSRFMAWKTKGMDVENIKQEFAITSRIFKLLLELFEEVVVIPGNHDGGRFQHLSNGSIDFSLLCAFMIGCSPAEMPENLIVGMNRWLVMEGSPRGDWRITHPAKSRKVPLMLAEELAAKFQQNILTAHQHHLGVRMHRHLPYICCDGGCLQDERLTDYKQETDDSHANWAPGWVELVDGWPLCQSVLP